ncbi:hypothetical protein BAZSYMA_ACONTIG276387_1 [Bathymodiolus azoricus thioautotrophic gill symbiont]|uniref:Uncharacterized protein n=1 Tax=Bathymodiolus azoricus thioautotrophic gill symbiont TaxID=235205 RepID=A0A1H6MX76_9GAMM|nr:hypothetical protein BAZSYMA_ACONTIG276387_1 [Bathymodiolus azoricus thioautotrophic gill symbiont]
MEVQTHPMHPLKKVILRFPQPLVPLPLLEPMAQSRHGATQIMEVQVHPLTKVIPRFIQIHMPLLPLHMMAQSRCGAIQILEA